MKRVGIILLCVVMFMVPLNVKAADSVLQARNYTSAQTKNVTIPDVTGMTEEEAIGALQNVVLPGGDSVEIIKKYEYSSEYTKDIVFEQTPIGKVTSEKAQTVNITISMGEEPNEDLATASMNTMDNAGKLSSFGIAHYSDEKKQTSYNLGIDWNSLPYSYEYNWDNSLSCWYWGMWANGHCYMTPEGEYSTDVRHLMQLYCDGTNVYLHITFATVYWTEVNGDDYQFIIDGHKTQYQLKFMNGGTITGKTDRMKEGTYQIRVVNSGSNKTVNGSLAYLTLKEDNHNAEIEMMIPLSEIARQNPRIDLENMSTIEFMTYNLMYRTITASGASTFPMATAGAVLLLIPGSTYVLKKRNRKKMKETDGQKI